MNKKVLSNINKNLHFFQFVMNLQKISHFY